MEEIAAEVRRGGVAVGLARRAEYGALALPDRTRR